MRRYNRTKKNRNKKLFVFIAVILFVLIFSFLAFIFFKVSTLDKFVYVNRTKNGLTQVVVNDSPKDRVITYNIAKDTILISSRGFGEYKIESLWVLAKKENFEGKLVSESISSNYLIPLYLWKDNLKTNLNIYQRIKVFFSKYQNNNIERELTSFDLPNSILIDFIDNDIQEASLSVELDDLTSDPNVINSVSAILGNLGTKISLYTKGYEENFDCEIYGKNIKAVKIISNIFDCKINETEVIASDIKIKLGAKFADRF